MKVFVSILPQAYFVERIGGDRVDVSVMVGPGQSPPTYEPRPRQLAELGRTRLYFRIGVDFEDAWMERISKVNPQMRVVDTRQGITLRPMKASHHSDHDHGGAGKDPHIWLSLRLVQIQAETICKALAEEDPLHRDLYGDNLEAFRKDLRNLDEGIGGILKQATQRRFMVFHPAWGYFARDYGLEQIPIEIEGKEPSAKDLAHLIEEAKHMDVKVIFVQKQFSKQSAAAVARAIGGEVVSIDPLSKDYLNNMKRIAETFAEVLQ